MTLRESRVRRRVVGRCTRCTTTSPSSNVRPCSASPVRNAADSDSTPAMAATPSTRQAKKMRKPDSRERISRRANRKGEKNGAHAARVSATMRPSFSRTMRPQRLARLSSCVTRNSVGLRARMQREEQIGDLRAGLAVEIAGRLVGEQHGGPRRDGARERDALLLAAGELARIVIDTRAEADGTKFGLAPGRTRRARRRARAARRRSPAPSWSGSDERTGTRCRRGRAESAPAHPRPAA